MKKPFTSFAVGMAIYFLLLTFFAFLFFKQFTAPQISLEIDADLIGEIAQHEKSKTKSLEEQNLQKISDQKNTVEKSQEEKLQPPDAKLDKEEEHDSQKIPPIFQPLPEIPDELRSEAFHTKAIVRFYVDVAGNVTRVELIRPASNPRLNQLLLKSLKKWKFDSNRTGFVQDITVTFQVE